MRPSVLVVDDERSFRLLAEEALSSEGFDVRTAGTLARARIELDKTAPDVMILDRRLPDGDGIDLLRELTSRGAAHLQVIVVTAYADVNNAVEALQAGAVDYLTKPLQVTDLIIKLRKVLETRGCATGWPWPRATRPSRRWRSRARPRVRWPSSWTRWRRAR